MFFQKKLIRLEEVLKSFTAILTLYRVEMEKIVDEYNSSMDISVASSGVKVPESGRKPDDSVIYDSIVIRNM